MTGYIYGLYDTSDPSRIRYVGQTRQALQDRIYGHLWGAASGRTLGYPSGCWILSIGADRLGVRVLEEPPLADLNKSESHWIREFKALGEADLNVAEGGGVPEGHARGEHNPRARLTWDQVRFVRGLAVSRYVDRAQMARELGVTPAAVSKILLNKSWRDTSYDPSDLITVEERQRGEEPAWRTLSDSEVERARAIYLETGSVSTVRRVFNLSRTTAGRILFERYGSSESREKCVALRGPVTPPRRLTPEERSEVLSLAQAGGMRQSEIASQFGISQSAVSHILKEGKLRGTDV